MRRNKERKKPTRMTFEVIVVMIIAGLMILLNEFTTNKFNEIIINDREALLFRHEAGSPVHEELAKQIVEFRPDACKMIEVYSDDFQPLFQVQFISDSNPGPDTITQHPELVDLFAGNPEGHTAITIDEKDEDIYFQWTETETGDKCLIIIYMCRPVIKNLWVFNFICYIIMILIFILLIRLHMLQYHAKIQHYQTTSLDVQDKLINR